MLRRGFDQACPLPSPTRSIRLPTGRGGKRASSTRSIRARFRTATATGSAISQGSSSGSTISLRSASMRSGCRRSSPRRWPTSATTSPTTAASSRCSAIWPISTGCSPRSTRAGSSCCSISCPTTARDQHPWFVESRSSAHSSEARLVHLARRPRRTAARPTTGSATSAARPGTWDEATGQYYLHAFLKEQPDLNWRNPEVRAAMIDVLRFWLDRGVDGFRIDVLWHIVKAEGLPDNPTNPDWRPGMNERDRLLQLHSTDQPEAHAIAAEMRALADELWRARADRRDLPAQRSPRALVRHARAAPRSICRSISQLIENRVGRGDARPADRRIRSLAARRGGWPNWVIGSHDAPRIAARIGEAQARVAAMLLLTLRGTPTLYQGDELGIGEVDDPARSGPRSARPAPAGPRPRPRPLAHADAVGRLAQRRVQQRPSRGCRSTPTGRRATSPRRTATRLDAGALPRPAARCGERSRRLRSATSHWSMRDGDVLAYRPAPRRRSGC